MQIRCLFLFVFLLAGIKSFSQGIGLVLSDTLDTKGVAPDEVISIADKALAMHYEEYKSDLQFIDNNSLLLNHTVKVVGVAGKNMMDERHTYRLRVEVEGDKCFIIMDNVKSDRGVTPTKALAFEAVENMKTSNKNKEILGQLTRIRYERLEGEFSMIRNVVAIGIR